MTLIVGNRTPRATWSPEARAKIREYEAAVKREERAKENIALARAWLKTKTTNEENK